MTATTTVEYIDGGPDDVPCIPNFWAALTVSCPKCKVTPGASCESTGGGNRMFVATHKARIARIAGWTNRLMDRAEQAYRGAGINRAAMPEIFAEFEAAATPIPTKVDRPVTPKGVRLSEKQAETVEH